MPGLLSWVSFLTSTHTLSACTQVQHHDMHHRYPKQHFSLYFTHWDRWCGTMHPRYESDLFSYFSPKKGGPAADQAAAKQD